MKWLDRSLIVGPYLTLCTSEEDYKKTLAHLEVPTPHNKWVSDDANATMHEFTHPTKGICCIVCVRPNDAKTGIQMASLMIHEAVHVVQAYMDYIGERNPSTEFQAYSIQNVAQELMQSYAEQMVKDASTQEQADKLILKTLRGIYDAAGVEVPKSFDPDREIKRLVKGLRNA